METNISKKLRITKPLVGHERPFGKNSKIYIDIHVQDCRKISKLISVAKHI